jgi:hypothetical protein
VDALEQAGDHAREEIKLAEGKQERIAVYLLGMALTELLDAQGRRQRGEQCEVPYP